MKIQIKGKTFHLELSNGFLKIGELYNNRKRWIKFPVKLIDWVSVTLQDCSELIEFEHCRRFGCLWWKIQSGCNRWGWFLKLSVKIKGLWYSVFVPALGSDNPWKNFIHAFFHVAQEELKVVGFDGDCHNACLDSFSILQHDISHPHDSELKLEVDALLILENMQIGSSHPNLESEILHVKEPSILDCVPLENVGVIKEKMLANPERLPGSVGVSGIASALSFANEMCINGGSSFYIDGDEGSSSAKGDGTILDSVEVVSEVSILSPNPIMSNVVPKSSVRRLAKKNQCPLLNHLGFNRSMEKKNGIQLSKRRCSVSYPNG